MQKITKIKSKLGLILLLCLCGCSAVQKVGEVIGDKELVKASSEMTPQQEYYLGRSIAAQILSENKMVVSGPVSDYLNLLGQYLVLHSPRSETFNGYRFAVVSSDVPTALSAPGGYIFLSSALVKVLESEDELAAVLAHEISHIGLKHANASIQKKNAMKSISKYGSMIVAVVSNGAIDQDGGEAFSQLIGNLVNIKYDKTQEIDADLGGVSILTDSGYDSHALLTFLNRLKPDAGLLSRHPRSEERLKRIKAAIGKSSVAGTISERQMRFVKWKTQVLTAPAPKS